MDSSSQLPPRPQPQKKALWRLEPSAQTKDSWQTLVAHPKRIELAVIILCIISLPFTIIAAIKYHYLVASGIVSALLTILASLISLWLYTRNRLSCGTCLLRSIIFCVGWFITDAAARYGYWYHSDNDINDDDDTIDLNFSWVLLVRSLLYWGLSVVFFIYLVFSGVAFYRQRNRRRTEQYRMQAAAGGSQYPYGPGQYASPPAYQHGAYAPPGGPPPAQYQYQPPAGPPPDRLA